MSWSSGTRVMGEIIDALNETDDLSEAMKIVVYMQLIPVFEANDCDTLDECKDDDYCFGEAWRALYPEEEIEDEGLIDEY